MAATGFGGTSAPPTGHARNAFRRRHNAQPSMASDAAAMSGWIGAHTFRAPLTPIAAITTLLHTGQPTASNYPMLARKPARPGAKGIPEERRTYVAASAPLKTAVSTHAV
jgi:hypothetical protein